MTKLLKKAFQEASKLPDIEQNSLAKWLMEELEAEDVMKGCICHLILTGLSQPNECMLFGKACTPENPQGPCMVSSEGTCRAHYLYPEEIDV